MVSSSTAYCGKPLRAHSHPADVPPTRPECRANPLPERIPSRRFPGVNSGRISSRFCAAAVLDMEIKRESKDAPSPRNTMSFLFPDGIQRLQGHCSSLMDHTYQCLTQRRSRTWTRSSRSASGPFHGCWSRDISLGLEDMGARILAPRRSRAGGGGAGRGNRNVGALERGNQRRGR